MDDYAKIKTRVSYKKFSELLVFLNTNPSKADILKRFHKVIDDYSGFGSQRNSDAALESLNVVIAEAKGDLHG